MFSWVCASRDCFIVVEFAGKTTLIKALTGDSELEPKDQLFATLDVTAHAGKLPNNMTVIFMDTVGFISDIPVTLIDAFAATLEDAMLAVSVCVYVNECVCVCVRELVCVHV